MGETICCPLTECDEGSDVFFVSTPRAAKEHRCCECDKVIVKGERHTLDKGLQDGTWWRHRTCLLCTEIRSHFSCGQGYYLGMLWSDLEENFLPTMPAGGPCMEGLSARAKAELFERKCRLMEI